MNRTTPLKWYLFLLVTLLSAQVSLGADSPILLVGTSSDQFSFYYSEILRAEGLNAFDAADLSAVTADTLSAHDVVILGQMALTPTQVTMFTSYVNGGGNLVAMRPDKQLASLLGISDTGTSLSNGYLLVNTSGRPGLGIVGQPIQFHGTADLYTQSGASTVATLYSNIATATPSPAVTLRAGIGAGGNAVAFVYDLAKSIVYTRQGNPAWAEQHRVGQGGPIRAVDMFYGGASFDPQPDWVDLSNVAIPQADEQQRLLANVILYLNQAKKPLPRFWYFPGAAKAVVVMTGDDHGSYSTGSATRQRFSDLVAASPSGCAVADWQCVRATSYLFPQAIASNPLTDSEVAAYSAQGFEIGLQVDSSPTCSDWTSPDLDSDYTALSDSFVAQFPSLPPIKTHRMHCTSWSDFISQPQVELTHGIRFDTNYYYWPLSWVNDQPGMFTGSGMPMRFADTNGNIVDVYQAATQMTDESGQSYPLTIDTLLDNALGASGYYGAFVVNAQNDIGGYPGIAPSIVASAHARGVPIVSSLQMLTWLDGRNGSSFGAISWDGNALDFTITAGPGANGLQAMLPTTTTLGGLISLTQGSNSVPFTVQTIKGVEYAFFPAAPGSYKATYAVALPLVITTVTATPGATAATITWTTDRDATSRVDYGTSPTALSLSVTDPTSVTSHSIDLTVLVPGTTYYYRVTSTDASGTSATAPPIAGSPASFTIIDPTPPVITAVTAESGNAGTASFTWTTSKPSDSQVSYGTSPTSLTLNASNASMVIAHSISLAGLTPGQTYYFRVTSADATGNSATSPAPPNAPGSFVVTSTLSVWSASVTPGTVDSGEASSVELGMKFRSDVSGFVTGVRFYKAAANTGMHVGNLWTSDGTLLGTVTFGSDAETASGWQHADFAAPLPIAANSTYIVSYFAPNGHYSMDGSFFKLAGVDTPPLHALASGVDGPNGVYLYSSTSGFPNLSFNDSNYWVDLQFVDNVPPVISAVAAAVTGTTATITWTTNVVATSRVDYGIAPDSLGLNASADSLVTAHSIQLTGLTGGQAYYYRVTSVDARGNSVTSPVLPGAPATFVPVSVAEPVIITALTATPGNTSALISWSTDHASDSRLDYGTAPTDLSLSVTDLTLVTSHSINLTVLVPGTTYYYRVTSTDASGTSATAPIAAGSPASFTIIDPTPPVITAVTAESGNAGTASFTWTTSKPSDSQVSYGTSPTSLTLNASNASMVIAHSISLAGLAPGQTYYFRVTSADATGNSATSPAPPSAPGSFVVTATLSVWSASVTPGTVDPGEALPIELGMKFRSDVSGFVTGVRFYKAAANTGLHVGNLWTSDGTLLGSVEFGSETASGWQHADFAAPIPIAANSTYIVSYFAPNGHFSIDGGFFTPAGVDTSPLHALASGVDGPNGVYLYSSTSGFPNLSFNDSNYWVDLQFVDNIPPVISAVASAVTATTATITWTTNVVATSRVDYGIAPDSLGLNATADSLVTAHSIQLTGLTGGQAYYYRVTSVDARGNSVTSPVLSDAPATFVPVSEPTGPAISLVIANPAAVNATITWTTDSPATSSVDYGTTTALGHAVSDPTLVTSHTLTISGLDPATTYYYRVTSVNAASVSSTSPPTADAPASFTTITTIPPVISAVTAVPNLGGVATIRWTTNKPADSRVDYAVSPTPLALNKTDSSLVSSHVIHLTGLTPGTVYYFRITSTDAASNTSVYPPTDSSPDSFTENAISIWDAAATPNAPNVGDTSSVELGVKFQSSVPGSITGIRYYKSQANSGTHIGNLWTSTGLNLGTVTFTGESGSGWQQADFATPIPIAANTTYVASYFAPLGSYSVDTGYFASAFTHAPLTALQDVPEGANGVFTVSGSSAFPTSGTGSSNYWVDIVFAATPATQPSVTLSPTSLTFNNQALGTTSPTQTITISNTGSTEVTLTNITITGTDSTDFAQTNTCGTPVAAGANCTIRVTFTPAATGARGAAVTITDNATGSPHTVSLIGTGAIPVVGLSPASLTFSSQAVGIASAVQSITLTNSGGAALNQISITITGTNSGDFAQTNTCGTTVAAGANCSIRLTFTPAATGARGAAVTITDNATDSPQTASVSGTGVVLPPAMVINPSFELGSSTPVTFTGTMNGGAAAATGWSVWNNVSGTTMTELCTTNCPSTSTPPAPSDGTHTLHVTTTGASSGVYQLFPKTTLTSASVWLQVVSGTVIVELVGPGTTVVTTTRNSGVIWLPANGAVFNEIAIYSQSGAAEFYADAVNLSNSALAPLSLSHISPASGPVGTAVTITGTGFGAAQGASTVAFNGTAATPSAWSDTSIQATVPSGATTGNVVVTVNGQPSNGLSYTVTLSLATNPSFELGSPTPVTFTGTMNGGAAAATGWSVWNNVSGTTMTELCTTSCPSGSNGPPTPADGGHTLHVTTTGASSGVYQLFPSRTLTSASVWLQVVSGTVIVELVGPGTTVVTTTRNSGVIWLPANGAVFNEIAIYSQSGAAEFYADAVNLSNSALAPLSLSHISPASGPVGTAVTITGTGFGAAQGASTVAFNGTAATPNAWSDTSIQATVPSGATTGNVVVTVNGQPSNGLSYTVALSVVINPSFELGSSTPVLFSGTMNGGAAAATGWSVWNNVNGTTMTELCTTSCPSGSNGPPTPTDGSHTLHVTTTGGASGVYQLFPKMTLTGASLWLHVVTGGVMVELFGPGTPVLTTTVSSGVILLPANGAIFNEIAIYSLTGGATEFYVDAVAIAP